MDGTTSGGSTVAPQVRAFAESVAVVLRSTLGGDLVGVYLHGSAATGTFQPERSDVDVLAVCSRTATEAEKKLLADALSEPALPCPGVGLEFSLVTLDVCGRPAERPPFELHLNTVDGHTVHGDGHSGDADLPMHFAMARERGVAIAGPLPEDVFAPIPRAWLLRGFAEDLAWALREASAEYAVLNACRAWAFLETGLLLSKLEGAAWMLARDAEVELVRPALAFQRGGQRPAADRTAVEGFVERVRALLLAATET